MIRLPFAIFQPSRKMAALAAFCIAFAVAAYLAPGYLVARLETALQDGGFNIVSIGQTHIGLAGIRLDNLKLDPYGNSTVAEIRAPFDLSSLYIKGLVLSGDIGPAGYPAIDGWTFHMPTFPKTLHNIVLDGGRLALLTQAGDIITVRAKGQMTATGPATRHIAAVISGDQQQLTFNTKWDIDWTARNGWHAAGEIGRFRVRLDTFEATRGSGWLNLKTTKDTELLPTLSGQINAGLVRFGPAIVRNAALTVNGPWRALDLILTGQPGGGGDEHLSLEARQQNGTTRIDAQMTAPTPGVIFHFLTAVGDGLAANGHLTGRPLSPLLLTEGNKDRMNQALAKAAYTSVTLKLTGQADALHGQIATNGTPPVTISFDPQKKAVSGP